MVLLEVQRANCRCSYKLVAMKLVSPSKEHLEKHYEDLSDKPFYKGLVTCATPVPTNLTYHRIRRLTRLRYAERAHLCYGMARP